MAWCHSLVHNAVPIIKAAAICEYIDEAFDGTLLKPDHSKDPARMHHCIWTGDDVH